MITERTLKKWRKNALSAEEKKYETIQLYEGTAEALVRSYIECQQRILRMTQILLDQHLMKGK